MNKRTDEGQDCLLVRHVFLSCVCQVLLFRKLSGFVAGIVVQRRSFALTFDIATGLTMLSADELDLTCAHNAAGLTLLRVAELQLAMKLRNFRESSSSLLFSCRF